MIQRSNRKRILMLLAAALCGSLVQAQQAFVEVMANGQLRKVNVVRIATRSAEGELVLFRDGAEPITLQPGQYIRAVGVKPPELDQAAAAIAKGNNKQAADLLQKAMRQSRFQSWDARAAAMLVDVLLEDGKTAAASGVLKGLQQTYGNKLMELYPEVQLVDWKVRIGTGSVAGLQEELTELIQDGKTPRAQKAMAQMMRGDLKTRREDYQSAVLDYMRTAYFYPDAKEVHAEALWKTANTFHKLGDAVRSRKYQAELKEKHPGSTFAGKPIGN